MMRTDPDAAAARTAYAGLVTTTTDAQPGVAGGEAASPLAVLFAPDRAMERQARVGRARWFFLFAWLCSILLGAAFAYRVDAKSSTLRRLETSGQLKTMSDRQIAEETRSAERVAQVGSIAKGVVGAPVQLGLGCVALLALGWFFRGRIKGSAVVPVAAATLTPAALANLVDAVTAFRHTTLPPEGVALAPRTLSAILLLLGRPLVEPWVRLGHALDFFSLWAAIMMGYGVVAVGQVKKRTALTGTLIAWVCYRLLTSVAMK
jgi:hypothetical protein